MIVWRCGFSFSLLMMPPLLAAIAVAVGVEAVHVGADDANLAGIAGAVAAASGAVVVGHRWIEARAGVRRMAARGRRRGNCGGRCGCGRSGRGRRSRRRRGRRGRGGSSTAGPDARTERAPRAFRAPVRPELPERPVIDLDLAEAAANQLRAQVAAPPEGARRREAGCSGRAWPGSGRPPASRLPCASRRAAAVAWAA